MFLLKFVVVTYLSLLFSVGANAEGVLHGMSGEDISLADLRGKWVFINYWASWCRPCLDEIPELNRFYEENKKNMALFAVNYDALPIYLQQQLIKKFNIRYPSLKQYPAMDLQLGDIRGVPVTFVFNPAGELTDALYGGQTLNSLKHVMMS